MSEDMKKDLMEDPEDEMLKAVMGCKFQDQTTCGPEGPGMQPKKKCVKSVPGKNPVQDVPTKVFGTKPGFMEKLRECGKWSMIFGGLCLVVFYWQQTGQMMPSAAVPSMMACTFGAAWCVGRACK